MIAHLQKIIDGFAERRTESIRVRKYGKVGRGHSYPGTKPPTQCRTCGKPAQVQLIQEPDLDEFTLDDVLDIKYEFLCYEDLGIFLEIFADPQQKEWTVVRL